MRSVALRKSISSALVVHIYNCVERLTSVDFNLKRINCTDYIQNPYLTNRFSHHYHLEESTFIFRGVRSDLYFFLSHFSMKLLFANRIAPDWTPRSARLN